MLKAVVLAAGKGTRLHSEKFNLPKVMREINGQPLLHYVLGALSFIPPEDLIIVAGYMKEQVMGAFPEYTFSIQEPQLGTGHAVLCAEKQLEGFDGTVLVCYGDMPLLKTETYLALLDAHRGNACTLLADYSEKELAYGRILRDDNGDFLRVVEDKDCTPEQKKIRELNIGIYAFEASSLISALKELKNDNVQKEYYLTDVPAILKSRGEKIGIYTRSLGIEGLGINTPEQLTQAAGYLNNLTK